MNTLAISLPISRQEEDLASRLARYQVNEFFRLVDLYREIPEQLPGLLLMGRLVRVMSDHPDFPDSRLADDVRATIESLQISHEAMAMSTDEADALLKQAGLLA